MIRYILGLALLLLTEAAPAQRSIQLIDRDWKFIKQDPVGAASSGFNDAAWETVSVPHDWAIKGPFDQNADAQTVTVTQDGEKKPALRTGRTGGLPWTGVGWYRKRITLPQSQKGKRVFIEFDGAMSHAQVYLNGDSIGYWPYGYASFQFELTGKFRFGQENVLAVRLENPEESSRWYPGAGIYRNVRLVITDPVHIAHWGTYITTPSVNKASATISVKTQILDQSGTDKNVVLQTEVFDPAGRRVAQSSTPLKLSQNGAVDQSLKIANPIMWDVRNPRLYKTVSSVIVNKKTTDVYETTFGIRSIAFDADKGFLLNGRPLKLKGVCNHHDLGPLGAAINVRALQRQLELLQDMGCNAIRTSHNPPAPELLDLCDKMGFLVLDEAFDEWKLAKCRNGYNKLFDQWAEKDLRAMIQRDRNHPSVILWSIGNEVNEQKDVHGAETAKFLVDIAHDEDPTRLTTSAFNSLDNAIKNGLAAAVDVVGFNYRTNKYSAIHKQYLQWKLLGTETNSAVSSRGEYMFPVVERKSFKYPNKQSSSYDLEAPSWGTAPDIEFALQEDNSFVAGEFVWTGFDYLGEPTPYNNDWPSHSSYFGIIDLAGLPKDRYFLYQSEWTNKKVVHLLPHWNWQGKEGTIVPVHAYTSYNAAELFVNGKSQGIQKKDTSKYGRFRLHWDSVRYQPGELKLVAFDDKGRKAAEQLIHTAGPEYAIALSPDRKTIKADGKDLCFITVTIRDEKGNICPAASRNILFKVEGDGIIKGVANGDPTNIQSLSGKEMKTFNGACVVVVESLTKPGVIKLAAVSNGLKATVIPIYTSK